MEAHSIFVISLLGMVQSGAEGDTLRPSIELEVAPGMCIHRPKSIILPAVALALWAPP